MDLISALPPQAPGVGLISSLRGSAGSFVTRIKDTTKSVLQSVNIGGKIMSTKVLLCLRIVADLIIFRSRSWSPLHNRASCSHVLPFWWLRICLPSPHRWCLCCSWKLPCQSLCYCKLVWKALYTHKVSFRSCHWCWLEGCWYIRVFKFFLTMLLYFSTIFSLRPNITFYHLRDSRKMSQILTQGSPGITFNSLVVIFSIFNIFNSA